MASGNVGRPRKEGDRYPSGDLKPASTPAPAELARTPISGALWQRMLADAERVFGDARYGTELGRLGATGQLTPSEVATGFRIAGIYGRFEYYHGKRRSAASPHYIREYISEGAGEDTELNNFRFTEGRERDRSYPIDDADAREREATAAFKELQDILEPLLRAQVERLCVENEHVGHQGLVRARIGLAVVKKYFADKEAGRVKRARKKKRAGKLSIETPVPTKKPSLNPFKDAFFKVRRAVNPNIVDTVLEREWETLCAVKALDDFRREKAERAS